jgi:hypothetical protein
LDPEELAAAQTARAIAVCAETGDWPLASLDGWWCAQAQCSYWASCPAGAAPVDRAAA